MRLYWIFSWNHFFDNIANEIGLRPNRSKHSILTLFCVDINDYHRFCFLFVSETPQSQHPVPRNVWRTGPWALGPMGRVLRTLLAVDIWSCGLVAFGLMGPGPYGLWALNALRPMGRGPYGPYGL